MLQHCLICTDLKDGLQRLTKFVDSLEHSGLTEITFLHSVPLWTQGEIPRVDNDKIKEVKTYFDSQLSYTSQTIKVNVEVVSGEAVNNIIDLVNKQNIDFVILGTSIRSAIQESLFGSTATNLTKKLQIPVMILRPQLISIFRIEELALRCEHLNRFWLLPYKGGKSSRYLIDQVKKSCEKQCLNTHRQILLLTVVEDISRSQLLVENNIVEAKKELITIKKELESVGLDVVDCLVKKGDPISETLNVALEYDISTIAIADDRDNILLDWTIRSFGQEILHRSWFPLLYFPLEK